MPSKRTRPLDPRDTESGPSRSRRRSPGTGLGVGMHIDGAGRRLLKLIPHQSFYKRAVGQVQRRLRVYISYYIEWSG